jgi:hypothetical protein
MSAKENYISLLDHPIAFHRVYAQIGGGAAAGVFFSQLIYWHKQMKKAKGPSWDGWFYKTAIEWEEETCTTRREREVAEKALVKQNIIKITKRKIPAKKHYQVNETELNNAIYKFITCDISSQASKDDSLPDVTSKNVTSGKQQCQIEQTSLSDVANSSVTSDKLECHILQSNTENTQRLSENTTDTCASGEPKSAGGENIDSVDIEKIKPWISRSGVELTGKHLELFSGLWGNYGRIGSRAAAIDAYLKIITPMFTRYAKENRTTYETLIKAIKSHVMGRTPLKTTQYFENWILDRNWEVVYSASATMQDKQEIEEIPRWKAKGFNSESDCKTYDDLATYCRTLEGVPKEHRHPHQQREIERVSQKLEGMKPQRAAA